MKLKLRLAAVVLGVAAIIAAIKYFSLQERLGSLLRWVDSLGNWGPAAFIVIYIAGCVLFVPGSALTLGAGILFGVLRGLAPSATPSIRMPHRRKPSRKSLMPGTGPGSLPS